MSDFLDPSGVIPEFEDELEFIGDSSCVGAAKYSQTNRELTIQFTDGTTYTYTSVHPFMWYNLLRALSKGEFFNRNIRNNYQFYEGSPA